MEVTFKNKQIKLNKRIQFNQKLQPIKLVDKNLNEINTKDVDGLKLYLTLPSVDTRVCSMELAKMVEMLKDEEITILSISMDLPFALDRWCLNHVSENLIATSDFRYHDFERITGLLMPQVGLFARAVILVDHENIIRYIDVNENVSDEPNYQEVINQIQLLK